MFDINPMVTDGHAKQAPSQRGKCEGAGSDPFDDGRDSAKIKCITQDQADRCSHQNILHEIFLLADHEFPQYGTGNGMDSSRDAVDGYPSAFVDLVHQKKIYIVAEILLIGEGLIKSRDSNISV